MRETFTIDVVSADSKAWLLVELNVTRSTILAVRAEGADVVGQAGWGVLLRVPPATAQLRLVIEHSGEPMSVLRIKRAADPDSLQLGAVPTAAERFERRHAGLLELRAEIEAMFTGDPDRARQLTAIADMEAFFLEYDEKTYPATSPYEPTIRETTEVLLDRLRVRWDLWTNCNKTMALPDHFKPAQVEPIRLLSDLQLGIMRRHYAGSTEGLDVPKLALAFRLFAAGRLGSCEGQDWHKARPDSAYVFLFAEFGSQVIDLATSSGDAQLESDARAWASLLPVFVATELLFRQSWGSKRFVCKPPEDDVLKHEKCLGDYGPSQFPGLTNQAIDDALAGYDLSTDSLQLHTSLIASAFGAGIDCPGG